MSEMIYLDISGNTVTPKVFMNNKYLLIEGVSIPENTNDYYSNIIDVLTSIFKSNIETYEIRFYLDYFNTASSFQILKILKLAGEYSQNKIIKSSIVWMHDEDDEDMKESGEYFKTFVNDCEFIIKPI